MAWMNKRFLGYVLFTILLTAAFLYYRFPSDAFGSYLKEKFERLNPRYSLSVEKVIPAFPPGLTLQEAELSLKSMPDLALFQTSSLVIRPQVWSFLKGKAGYRFECMAYGGDLDGSMHSSRNSIKAPFSASLTLKDIRIDKYTAFLSAVGRDIKGSVEGTIQYNGRLDSLINGTGEAEIKISKGRIELLQPILSLDAINFESMLMSMALKDQKVEVSKANLKGQEITGELSGTVFLKKEIQKSRLNLRGNIELLSGAFRAGKGTSAVVRLMRNSSKDGKLSFIISGTFASPTFRLI